MKRLCLLLIAVMLVFHIAYADMWAPEKSHNLQLAQAYISSKISMSEAMLDELFDVCVYEEPENHLWNGLFICKDIPEHPYRNKVASESIRKPSFIISMNNDQVIECDPQLMTIIDDIRKYYRYITEYNALCKASEYWEYVWNSEWILWTPIQKADFYNLYHRYPYQADFSYSYAFLYPPDTADQNEIRKIAMDYVNKLDLDPDNRCRVTGMEYSSSDSDSNNLWGITGYEFYDEQWRVVYVIALNDDYDLVNYYAYDSSGKMAKHKNDKVV